MGTCALLLCVPAASSHCPSSHPPTHPPTMQSVCRPLSHADTRVCARRHTRRIVAADLQALARKNPCTPAHACTCTREHIRTYAESHAQYIRTHARARTHTAPATLPRLAFHQQHFPRLCHLCVRVCGSVIERARGCQVSLRACESVSSPRTPKRPSTKTVLYVVLSVYKIVINASSTKRS